ncbi:hypothetical protein DPMN_079214 [Dreissena polymorpha]|uniref:Uncharacterized protein n=1 Tax=Dreissena polymorpha TaxID=45954 RepID=A0A9D3YU26_DREPO|nr:hypothetical protein DPMN_079214 [Dreissena polymorpha]
MVATKTIKIPVHYINTRQCVGHRENACSLYKQGTVRWSVVALKTFQAPCYSVRRKAPQLYKTKVGPILIVFEDVAWPQHQNGLGCRPSDFRSPPGVGVNVLEIKDLPADSYNSNV